MSSSGQSSLLASMREQYTESFEHTIIDWLQANGLEDAVFYPQGNQTILITWATPDSGGDYLFREIDVVVEGDDLFRCAGGAIYHAPHYCLSWMPAAHISEAELQETLDRLKGEVDALNRDDLVDMDEFQETYMFRFDMN